MKYNGNHRWRRERLDPLAFPDQPRPGSKVLPTTLANFDHLLTGYGLSCRFDVIKKRLELTEHDGARMSMTRVLSLAELNGLGTLHLHSFVSELADGNPHNPVEEWIRSKPWDGVDRLPAIYATVTAAQEYPPELKATLLFRWLISAVAAALVPSGFHCRGVLTLQGTQGLGKTSWGKALVSDPALCADFIRIDHHLDGGNKDSVLLAISHWITEIGELDSSFKKDVARLKGFLTSGYDKLRRPYARDESEYPRRTVFFATVNDPQFLIDSTGNSRWWTIPVEKLEYQHGIDMQQLYAQLAELVDSGERWWLSADEERQLEQQNRRHRSVSVVVERLLEKVDVDAGDLRGAPYMTAIELLGDVGFLNPTNAQCKECGAFLREAFGGPKRVNGRDKWRIPFRREPLPTLVKIDPSDCY